MWVSAVIRDVERGVIKMSAHLIDRCGVLGRGDYPKQDVVISSCPVVYAKAS